MARAMLQPDKQNKIINTAGPTLNYFTITIKITCFEEIVYLP